MYRFLLITFGYLGAITAVVAVNVFALHKGDPLLGDAETAFVIYHLIWSTLCSPAYLLLLIAVSRLPRGMHPLLAGLLCLLMTSWLGLGFEVGWFMDNTGWSVAPMALVVAASFLVVELARWCYRFPSTRSTA